MRKINLQIRVFITYLIMSILLIGSFTLIFHHYTSRILIERETKSVISLNKNFQTQIDDVVHDMDSVSTNISYSNLVKEKLYANVEIKRGSDDFRNLVNLFVAINGTDLTVDQINLYDFSGNLLQVGITTNSTRVDLDSLEWFPEVNERGGRKTLSNPYPTKGMTTSVNSSKTSTWCLSLYRTFNNEFKTPIGVIETVKKCDSVFRTISTYQKKNKDAPNVYVYDENGTLIYPYKPEHLDAQEIPDYFAARDLNSDSRNYHNPIKSINEIIAYETSSYTGWTYITVLPESDVLMPVQSFSKLLIGVIFAMLILCAFIAYQFSKGVTKPIRQLRQIVRKTSLGNLGKSEQQSLQGSFDEIEDLNQDFARMSANLKTSMDNLIEAKQQEFKSRSLALQSQINPHFYYNTLASIIVLAENEQSKEVVEICHNLTRIMRYVTDGRMLNVSLGDELTYIRQYLDCMKVRYQANLTFDIDINDELLTEQIPKLVIQPLVENALKYSTNTCPPPWHVSITGIVHDDYWQIDIIDSGSGFDEESISLINKRIAEASSNPGMPDMKIDGMGLLNVYLRWKYFCKDDIIFSYGNTATGHGIVSLGRKHASNSDNHSLENEGNDG